MIKTTAMLLEELKGYASPKSKLSRMVERGECFPITRGLYETDPNVPAHLLAGSIYGPILNGEPSENAEFYCPLYDGNISQYDCDEIS